MAKKSPPPEDDDEDNLPLPGGETGRYDCNSCSVEFEVTLEPKLKVVQGTSCEPQPVVCCPFCGSDTIARSM